MKKELLTTMEVAEKLGVTRWRINAMIRDERLPAERYGGIWLVNEKDLAAVMVRKNGRPKKEKPDAPDAVAPEPKTLLSVEAAAAFLKCSEKEIKKMIRDSRLPIEKSGGRRMINEKDLLKND